jgi:hypothetical protein
MKSFKAGLNANKQAFYASDGVHPMFGGQKKTIGGTTGLVRVKRACHIAWSRSFNAVGIFRQTNFQNSICAASLSFKFC